MNWDLFLYIAAIVLFVLAAFNLQISMQGDRRTSIGWQWLAFAVLVATLIF